MTLEVPSKSMIRWFCSINTEPSCLPRSNKAKIFHVTSPHRSLLHNRNVSKLRNVDSTQYSWTLFWIECILSLEYCSSCTWRRISTEYCSPVVLIREPLSHFPFSFVQIKFMSLYCGAIVLGWIILKVVFCVCHKSEGGKLAWKSTPKVYKGS